MVLALEELSCTNPYNHVDYEHAVFEFFDFLLGLFEFIEDCDHHCLAWH